MKTLYQINIKNSLTNGFIPVDRVAYSTTTGALLELKKLENEAKLYNSDSEYKIFETYLRSGV